MMHFKNYFLLFLTSQSRWKVTEASLLRNAKQLPCVEVQLNPRMPGEVIWNHLSANCNRDASLKEYKILLNRHSRTVSGFRASNPKKAGARRQTSPTKTAYIRTSSYRRTSATRSTPRTSRIAGPTLKAPNASRRSSTKCEEYTGRICPTNAKVKMKEPGTTRWRREMTKMKTVMAGMRMMRHRRMMHRRKRKRPRSSSGSVSAREMSDTRSPLGSASPRPDYVVRYWTINAGGTSFRVS